MATEAKIVITADDRTGGALGSVRAGLGGVNAAASSLSRLLPGLIPAATIAGMVAFARNVADGVDRLNDMADATGASIENLSALEDIAARNGTSVDTVATAMVRFNKVLADAQQPGGQAANILEQIGLNARALQDLDPAEALRQTAVALSRFADDGNKARLVQELFGKSIGEVAPMLKDLAEQQTLNAKVTTEQAKAAEQFNKELFAMQKNVLDLSRDMAGPLISSLNALIAKFREGSREGRGFWATLRNESTIFNLGRDFGDAFRQLGGVETQESRRATVDAMRSGDNQSAAETARLSRRQSVGTIAEATKKAGKSDAQRERERLAEENLRYMRNMAAEEGEAVLEENRRIQAQKKRDEQDYINWRRDQISDEGEELMESNRRYQAERQQLAKEEMEWRRDMIAEEGEALMEANRKLQEGARELSITFASAFEDAIIGGKKLSDVLGGLAQDIGRIFLRDTITQPLAGWASKGFSSLFGGFKITDILPSFDVGTPYVPRDMVAQIHQGERIIPASQNKPGAMGGITYAPVINIDARADAGAVQATVSQALARNNEQFVSMLQRQGVLA